MAKTDSHTEQKKCFVISPIGGSGSDIRKQADLVFEYVILPAVGDNYIAKRADKMQSPGMITDEIIAEILESELAIADLTGLNPNVFYEVGIRHTAQKPSILIAQEGTELPFDTAGQNTVFYDPMDVNSHQAAVSRIRDFIQAIEAPDYKVSNPISQSLGYKNLMANPDSEAELIAALHKQVQALRYDVKMLKQNEERFLLRKLDLSKMQSNKNKLADVLSASESTRIEAILDNYNRAIREIGKVSKNKKELGDDESID